MFRRALAAWALSGATAIAPLAMAATALAEPVGKVRDSDLPKLPGRVDLDVKDADVRTVLSLFADVANVNLVIAEDVKGKVTLKLRSVEWQEAMAVVLKTHQLGVERSGDILTVDTLARMTDRAEKKARIAEAKFNLAPLKTVLIPVRYARAKDLEPIVRSMLTGRGTVAIDQRTNTLIVTDVNAEDVRAKLTL